MTDTDKIVAAALTAAALAGSKSIDEVLTLYKSVCDKMTEPDEQTKQDKKIANEARNKSIKQ